MSECCKLVAATATLAASNPATVVYVCTTSMAVLNPEVCTGAMAYNALLKQPMFKELNKRAFAQGCDVLVEVTKADELVSIGIRKARSTLGETMDRMKESIEEAERTISFINTPDGINKLLQALGGGPIPVPGQ